MKIQKWEYKTEYILRDIFNDNTLNRFGEDGWELVTVDDGKEFFKRPLLGSE